jgi:integrase
MKPALHKHQAARPVPAKSSTLALVLDRLADRPGLSPTRRRDLCSAVRRVAHLLEEIPAAVELNLDVFRMRLKDLGPAPRGLTAKSFANLRSDFLGALKESGLLPSATKAPLRPAWRAFFARRSTARSQIGLSRLARFASGNGLDPEGVNNAVIGQFMAQVRAQSLHRSPNALHRQVTQIWNEAARDRTLRIRPVTVPSFRAAPKRIEWQTLPERFRKDVDEFLAWCACTDPFAADARSQPLAPRTIKLRRDQLHAAASSLIVSGFLPTKLKSLTVLVAPAQVKPILRTRFNQANGEPNAFNHGLAKTLVDVARNWVRVNDTTLQEIKGLVSKVPAPSAGLVEKNKRFLRQFEDPRALLQLAELPNRLWREVQRDKKPNFRTLAKAQTALAIAILTYMPVRLQNLASLTFGQHIFLHDQPNATSTLELAGAEVKNNTELAFDIPSHIAKMLLLYRDSIGPALLGRRPSRVFVHPDGRPKSPATIAWLIASYVKRRTGLVLTPHQFRHLGAKTVLDDSPGAFETVRQFLGHKNMKNTVNSYAGIDSRRAARHHQRLIEKALDQQSAVRRSKRPDRR